MAQWLLVQKNTTGTWKLAAKTMASLTSPSLVAPSPKYVTATESAPSFWMPMAYPVACRVWAPMMICGVAMLMEYGSQPEEAFPRQTRTMSVRSTPRQ
jgi:hypothetical protein